MPRAPAPERTRRRIDVVDIVKEYHTEAGTRRVLDGVSFSVGMGEKIAILGRNGAGKSTLIKLLSGLEPPTSGEIRRGLHMSWPLALFGGFDGEMTGYDTVRFITRVYGVDFKDAMAFIEDFTELGRQLYIPVRHYSDGMRARLGFALSLVVEFECLLIDEVIAVGDPKFQRRCIDELLVKRKHCAVILAIHNIEFVREHCTSALVLKAGRGRVFYDMKLATDIYATL